jgi:serine/threonine-protein kinase TTK/MPS1
MSLPAPASNSSVLVINNKRYMILKVVGKGGSSKVYEAVDELKNNVVAIKVVDLSHTDEAQAAGYVNEISMLAKLQGEDRIVKLFDYENDQKREVLYVVMEKGDTDLASLLKNYAIHKEITPAMVKHYWTEMLHAVHVIHKRGIIHSDLKPANFLLVAGRLKLIDFGIASSVQSDMTSVMKDTQMGTFNFMSPEAIQDLSGPRTDESGARRPLIKISYKSDVWSLGCILYNLAYGKMPFGDIKIPVMKLQAILNPDHQIPFPPENVDPLLLAVIKDCLTRDVKIRPSIEELLQHSYVTGIEAGGKAGSSSEALKSHMLAKLETNLQGVLSPGTFEKMKRAFQDPSLAKNLDI